MECEGTDSEVLARRSVGEIDADCSVSQRAEGHVALGVNSSPIHTYRVCNPPYLPSLWRDLCMPIFSLTFFILIYKIILSFTS